MNGKADDELMVCGHAYRPLCSELVELQFQLSMSLPQNFILRNQFGPGCLRHGSILVPSTILPRST